MPASPWASSPATCSISRVLPVPPEPVRVISRCAAGKGQRAWGKESGLYAPCPMPHALCALRFALCALRPAAGARLLERELSGTVRSPVPPGEGMRWPPDLRSCWLCALLPRRLVVLRPFHHTHARHRLQLGRQRAVHDGHREAAAQGVFRFSSAARAAVFAVSVPGTTIATGHLRFRHRRQGLRLQLLPPKLC